MVLWRELSVSGRALIGWWRVDVGSDVAQSSTTGALASGNQPAKPCGREITGGSVSSSSLIFGSARSFRQIPLQASGSGAVKPGRSLQAVNRSQISQAGWMESGAAASNSAREQNLHLVHSTKATIAIVSSRGLDPESH